MALEYDGVEQLPISMPLGLGSIGSSSLFSSISYSIVIAVLERSAWLAGLAGPVGLREL
jgi:hypothetical protein